MGISDLTTIAGHDHLLGIFHLGGPCETTVSLCCSCFLFVKTSSRPGGDPATAAKICGLFVTISVGFMRSRMDAHKINRAVSSTTVALRFAGIVLEWTCRHKARLDPNRKVRRETYISRTLRLVVVSLVDKHESHAKK